MPSNNIQEKDGEKDGEKKGEGEGEDEEQGGEQLEDSDEEPEAREHEKSPLTTLRHVRCIQSAFSFFIFVFYTKISYVHFQFPALQQVRTAYTC